MLDTFKKLDALLRGDLAQGSDRASAEIRFPIFGIILLSILLAMIFGACIGTFTAVSAENRSDGWMQLLASCVKAPLLFYLTLLVTFPSLYVFNALMGSRLNVAAALYLLVAAIAVMVTILASLGPIIVFFAFSTPTGYVGYRFILLLVVVLSAGAGFLGLNYLLRMLNRYADVSSEIVVPEVVEPSEHPMPLNDPESGRDFSEHRPSGLEERYEPLYQSAQLGRSKAKRESNSAGAIFRVWVVVFSIVGAQMSWVLRPFVGSPNLPFSWFRDREGNFFQTVFRLIRQMLLGD